MGNHLEIDGYLLVLNANMFWPSSIVVLYLCDGGEPWAGGIVGQRSEGTGGRSARLRFRKRDLVSRRQLGAEQRRPKNHRIQSDDCVDNREKRTEVVIKRRGLPVSSDDGRVEYHDPNLA